jgi:hypothetical protein
MALQKVFSYEFKLPRKLFLVWASAPVTQAVGQALMTNTPAKTPFLDLLRSVKVDSVAEITEQNGWSYHANYIGRLMHEAAEQIEKSAQQSEYLTALQCGLAVSILFNVVLLAVVLFIIGGR